MAGYAERAENQVHELLNRVIETAGSSSKPEDQKNAEIRRIIEQNCDAAAIAKRVLGTVKWNRATPEQRRAFTDAFIAYFSRKVGRKMADLRGYKIKVASAKLVGAHYEVSSSMNKQRQRKQIRWELENQGGQLRIVELYVGGFSATNHEAGNVRDIMEMHDGNIDRTIRTLWNRARVSSRVVETEQVEREDSAR